MSSQQGTCEIRVASRLGSVVASALGDPPAYAAGPRAILRISADAPIAVADLARRLDRLGLAIASIRVVREGPAR